MFKRLFIANRGEVAQRIARACRDLAIEPVFGVSKADGDASYVQGYETVCLGGARAQDSYLDLERIVQAAKQTRCSALHPGWGFLAENAAFASLCETHGIRFIGPPAQVIALMGSKTAAKQSMHAAGLETIPGSHGTTTSYQQAKHIADTIGYPILIKAESGGGGRGMRMVEDASSLEEAFTTAQAEARAAFGDPTVYIEKLLLGARHIEVQIMADRQGNVVHLGERDCTIQRNHQKLVEESPSPVLSSPTREQLWSHAVRAAVHVGYVGAGTVEFLVDSQSRAWFMEMNTRLQVEHPVTEMRSGLDLVTWQIRIAAGHPLGITQEQIALRGHAIECRINAEDPSNQFQAKSGTIHQWSVSVPTDGSIRVDTHVTTGYTVPPYYDSLLCKVIAYADTREHARNKLIDALEGLVCEGVPTTKPLHLAVLRSKAFQDNHYDTRFIPGWTEG